MTTARVSAWLAALLGVAAATAAVADGQGGVPQGPLCANVSGRVAPGARVAACSAMLAAGGLTVDQETETRLNRAWSLSLEGRMGEARADYTHALRLSPASHVAHNEYALFLLRTGDLDAAIAEYNVALAYRPNAAYSLYGRGIAFLREGKAEAGQNDLAAARLADSRVDQVFAAIGLRP